MTEPTHITRYRHILEHNQKIRHKTKVDSIGQKFTQLDKSRSYPDIESCKEVRSLVDDVGDLKT